MPAVFLVKRSIVLVKDGLIIKFNIYSINHRNVSFKIISISVYALHRYSLKNNVVL